MTQDSSTYWKKSRVELRAAGFEPDRAAKATAVVTIASAWTNAHRCNNRVRGIADPYVYLTAAAEALPATRRELLQTTLTARLREHPEVERVIDTRTVPARCAEGESVEALLCRAIPDHNGAALYAQARAGAFFDAGYALGRGTSHGSPYLFDRTVPMLVRAPGREPAGREVPEPISYTEFRRQVERLLGM